MDTLKQQHQDQLKTLLKDMQKVICLLSLALSYQSLISPYFHILSVLGHILSRIYNCTKHGNRPTDNAKPALLHCTFRFYNCTNCDQLHVNICPDQYHNKSGEWFLKVALHKFSRITDDRPTFLHYTTTKHNRTFSVVGPRSGMGYL